LVLPYLAGNCENENCASNSAGTVLGSPQARATWWCEPAKKKLFCEPFLKKQQPPLREEKKREKKKSKNLSFFFFFFPFLFVSFFGMRRKEHDFFTKNHKKTKQRDNREDLAGNVREVWGSTRGTPMPCRWFLEFVERQALRCYRMVVLGWTPLSQKPIPRPVAQKKISLVKNQFFPWRIAF